MVSYQEYITDVDESMDSVRQPVEVPSTYDKQNEFNLNTRGRRYDHQFFSMYQYRLSALKKRVDAEAMKKWGDGTIEREGRKVSRVDKILNISSNQLCWVSGTIYADMKNKLNILRDVDNGTDDVLPEVPQSYISKDETNEVIMLEDESGRAVLQGAEFFKNNILVTGTIVAILGIELQAGMFEIIDITYPNVTPQKPLIPPSNGSKIAFVSGLEISEPEKYNMNLELLKQYLQGQLPDPQGDPCQISHLVIAGNSIKELEQTSNDDYFTMNNYGTKNVSQFSKESLRMFNQFMNDISSTITISVIPGQSDPTDICLPQQPFHKSFFGQNKHLVGSNIQAQTNPAWLEIAGIRFLGTSGQNVDDIIKYLDSEKLQQDNIQLSIMESTLKWQNIAPTAPDTLYCYPFDNYDPFTLKDETPHVYFVGNQPQFGSKSITLDNHTTTKLVSIPKYCTSGQLVLLDTTTLECETITLSI